ncbi:putative transcription regulator mTERF family [Rosa chinensis]|uniref:Putative transcription regulator mTERF family n=1 Tax=Rosa chinensis TaxID=74649 RepID=A0A2P6SGF2_ROSCH|nr:putative transcription regulator mTERF family [Rosa chinensis]
MLCHKTECSKEDVNKVMSTGIEPSSSATFMKALVVTFMVDASKREQKMQFYKERGWTEDDFVLAFRKHPLFMTFSEKNISSKMDFLLNKMGWQPANVAGDPYVLTYSLEKRIIPTCSVIRVLLLKGLITKGECSLVSILKKSEKYLLNKIVLKYQEQVPELLSIYQGKMGLADLGLGFEDRARLNHL